jgi:hypothetical protein
MVYNMKAMTIKKLGTLLLLFMAVTVFGQQHKVQASVDSTKIRIGAQVNLLLKTTVDTAATVSFPEGKNFGQLEVLESYPVDTVRKGAMYELVKKYGITQFDSGRFVIPRLPVVINNKGVQTDSLLVEFTPVKVDTLKQKMYDIKPVLKARVDYTFWWYILGFVVVAAIGFGIWWFLRNKKLKPKTKKEEVVYTSPIEKATAQLKRLESKDLLQKGAVKDYYSELTDIARTYIEEAIHIPAMESTTSELIEGMRVAVLKKKMNLTQETFEQLEKILRNADMVKFAKSRPMDFEIAEDRARIEKTIVVIDRSIPEEKEEDDIHTQLWLEKQRKKKEKQRRTIIISVCAFVVCFALAFFGVRAYIHDSGIFGTETKELLEGNWIKSEYGNPGITIETPKVLKRLDHTKDVPKEAYAIIKEMQMFGYGGLFDDFYINVGTMTYKQAPENGADLNAALDGVVKTWEARGAKDILLKTETFKTPQGIEGIRSYGTGTVPHALTKQPVKMYYDLYLFKQQQGLQQVLVMYKEGDKYAPEILERIKNSIELRNLNE